MHAEPATRGARLPAPDLLLIAITAVWGGTFIVVKTAMQWSGAFTFVGLRFGLAAVLFGLACRRMLRGFSRDELRGGIAIGVAVFLGYSLQTLGLREISSSESGFYTALYVPMVPLLQIALFRVLPRAMAWVGIVMATAGMVLLSNPRAGLLAIDHGALLTMIGALAMAFEILLIGRYAVRCNVQRLAFVQLATVGVLGLGAALLRGEPMPQFTGGYVACVLAMALVSAFIQFGITWAQRTVPATRATVIYALEPVWAALVGVFVGDRLGWLGFIGGALIVLSVIVTELRWPKRRADVAA
ncbi:DMT family transporter [Solimonas marina]|uniref:DMT family transporter n=1 Tax=Solimonas marina TaxID=2714601 RepID=A0A970B843_9GAMM|nr:DMT family transporter [Solimonas marina]NKF24593.1 DMT family transporter [Solimonas marina]